MLKCRLAVILWFIFGCAPCFSQDARQAQFADLEFIRVNYVERSHAFTPADKKRALQFLRLLERRAGTMTPAQFAVAVMRIAAFARNAHDSVRLADSYVPKLRLPLRFLWFPDGLVVSRAAPEAAEFLGAKVVRFEGRTPPELLKKLRAVNGGVDRYLQWNADQLLQFGELAQAAGIARMPDRIHLSLVLRDGRRVSRVMTLVPSDKVPRGASPDRLWSPQPFANESELNWHTAVDGLAEPLYMQDPDRLFRLTEPQDLSAWYLQFRINFSYNGQKIAPFVSEVASRLKAAAPKNIVVDLRFDTGGDNTQTRELMRDIARSVPGRIYLLTDRYTFSAGIASAAALKHDGGERVLQVGGEVGDALRWWSEGKNICLPNSHHCLGVTTGLWDLAHGCAGNPDCYGDKFDCRVGTLVPKIAAPLTAAAWLSGTDPAMDAVRADLAKQR